MEVVMTAGAIGHAMLQSNHYQQPTNTKPFLQAGCPSCHPTNSVKTLKGISHFMDLLTPNSVGVFQLCLWPLIAPGYLGWGLPYVSSALCCQYPSFILLCYRNYIHKTHHLWDIRLHNAVTLKTGLRVQEGHWKCHHSVREPITSYWCSIVTMALSCVVSEIFTVEKHRDLEISQEPVKVIRSGIIR